MPLALRWQSLGAPAASSPLVAWLYAPLGLFFALTLDQEAFGGSLLVWAGLAGIGQLVVVAGLPLAGWLIHRLFKPRWWPVLTLLAMAIVAGLRGLAIDAIAGQLGLGEDLSISHWLVGDVITQTGFLALIGIRVAMRKEHEIRMRHLALEQASLAALDTTLAERNAEIDQRLSIQMGVTVEPRMRQLDALMSAVAEGADARPLVEALRTFADDEVRPLSHRLSEPVLPIMVVEQTGTDSLQIRERLPRYVDLRLMFRPLLVALIMGLIGFGRAGSSAPIPEAFVFGLTMAVAIGLLLLAMQRLFDPVRLRLWAAGLVAIVVNAAVVALVIWWVSLIWTATPYQAHLRGAIAGAILGVLSTVAAIVDVHNATAEEQALERVELLRSSINLARQRMWVIRRRLGYALHGSVQAALHVAAIRLSGPDSSNPEAIDAIRKDITAALERLQPRLIERIDVKQACEDLAETWQGTCEVTCDITPGARTALDNSPTAAECVIEVVLETVQNAIRHGHASTVRIDARLNEDRIELTVTDNGQWADGVVGQGTRMMDELCATWGRQRLGSGTQVRAELMVS